jgi:L-iditol 2-dehydrogenase
LLAVVKTAPGEGNVELKEVPEPIARPGWIVVEVAACGVCGTDLHILRDEFKSYPPVTLGHEYTGRVAEVGDGVANWHPGDRVVVEQHAGACGTCELCRRGNIHLCPAKRPPGVGIDGALAQRVVVPAWLAHRVPDDVSDRAAAMCEPLAIALTGLESTALQPGESVAVIGPGPVGLLAALAARHLGAGRLVVLGRGPTSRRRLELASELGLETLDTSSCDPVEALGASFTAGFNIVVEAAGAASTAALGVRLLGRGGRMACLGMGDGREISFPWDEAMTRALTLHFSLSSAYPTWDHALHLLRSIGPQVESLATDFPLSRWADAFEAVATRQVVKALLWPGS